MPVAPKRIRSGSGSASTSATSSSKVTIFTATASISQHRLEGVAARGGISLSEDAWRQVHGKVAANFVDTREHSLKNIARPVRVYRIELGGESATQPATPASVLPDMPSIAVLPFQNMSGDAEQDYFCDGLVEDIITTLSKLRDCQS